MTTFVTRMTSATFAALIMILAVHHGAARAEERAASTSEGNMSLTSEMALTTPNEGPWCYDRYYGWYYCGDL